jgi:hypothetical protein
MSEEGTTSQSTVDVSAPAVSSDDAVEYDQDEERNASQSTQSKGSWISSRLKSALMIIAIAMSGLLVGGAIPLIGTIGQFVGLFTGMFIFGLLSSKRQYVLVGASGGISAVALTLISTAFSVVAPLAFDLIQEYGIWIAGAGLIAGVISSVGGYYFGRDLKTGLTKNI